MADTIQQRKQRLEETIRKLDQQIQITTGINKENMDNTTKFNTDMTRWLGLINTQVLSLKPLIGNLQNLIKQLKSESGKVVDTGNDNSEMIRNLQEQLAQKNAEIADLKKQQPEGEQMLKEDAQSKFQEQLSDYQKQIADLNTRIQTLQAENRKLATDKQVLDEMINQSYQAIVKAGQTLGQVQKQQINEEEFKRVLTGIHDEVELIKTDLTNLLGGPPSGTGNSSSSSASGNSSSVNKIANDTQINIDGKDYKFGYIINELTRKNAQMGNKAGNKYLLALNNIRIAPTPDSIPRILKLNGIEFTNNDAIKGGKRRRKSKKTQKKRNVRKQKGGFEYSGKSKRRRFSVTRSTSKPRSSQPRTSSQPASSYETQSSVPNYRARGTKKTKM
jgi:predicted  nucleic acid-binding Zn-ribbon protein